jgi:hypothetical protein
LSIVDVTAGRRKRKGAGLGDSKKAAVRHGGPAGEGLRANLNPCIVGIWVFFIGALEHSTMVGDRLALWRAKSLCSLMAGVTGPFTTDIS